MQAFTFRFKAVLRQREAVEQQKQRALAKLMHQRNAMLGQLREMQETISTSKRQAADGLVGTVDLAAIAGIARYSASCALRGNRVVRELAQLETLVEQARNELMEASKNRKALELLRDRQRQAWELEQRRMEAKRLDEQTTQAYAAKAMAEPDRCEPFSPRPSSSSSSML
ncbi:MAG: flagellar export protein FliJ [Phycisphaeraceae bacterium]